VVDVREHHGGEQYGHDTMDHLRDLRAQMSVTYKGNIRR
jgi:hypothetical protein